MAHSDVRSNGDYVVHFDFDDFSNSESSFRALNVSRSQFFPYGTNYARRYSRPYHLRPLEQLADKLDATDHELQSAKQLAGGYNRLLIVLLEPSDTEDTSFEVIGAKCPTIKEIDALLKETSDRRFNINNTCIYDVRPFRPRWLREEDPEWSPVRYEKDEEAYSCFEQMVLQQEPDVVVVCQCQTSRVNNEMAKILCSGMARAGTTEERTIGERTVLLVYGFHPSVYLNKDYLEEHFRFYQPDVQSLDLFRDMLYSLLRLSFHIAINALAGQTVTGDGVQRLRTSLGLQPHPLTSSIAGRRDVWRGGSVRASLLHGATFMDRPSAIAITRGTASEPIVLDD